MVEPAEIFTKHLQVGLQDLDEQHHVNNVQYVQWVQNIAKEHWELRATPQLKKKFLWVLVRHEIDYKKQAFLNDPIVVETYVGEVTHVTSERYVNIRNEATGELLVSSKSIWCLLDSEHKKPTRITRDLRQIFHKKV